MGPGELLTVVHGLEVIDEGENVLMAHRHLLEYSNLIPYLDERSV